MLLEAHRDRVSLREIRDAMAGLLGTEHEAVGKIECLIKHRRNGNSPMSYLCDPEDGMLLMLSCFLSSAPSEAPRQLIKNVVAVSELTR